MIIEMVEVIIRDMTSENVRSNKKTKAWISVLAGMMFFVAGAVQDVIKGAGLHLDDVLVLFGFSLGVGLMVYLLLRLLAKF